MEWRDHRRVDRQRDPGSAGHHRRLRQPEAAGQHVDLLSDAGPFDARLPGVAEPSTLPDGQFDCGQISWMTAVMFTIVQSPNGNKPSDVFVVAPIQIDRLKDGVDSPPPAYDEI